MKKVAAWLSNSITASAALYEFEETILPKIHDTKRVFETRKIEDRVFAQDIDKFYADIDKSAKNLIHAWDKKLELIGVN